MKITQKNKSNCLFQVVIVGDKSTNYKNHEGLFFKNRYSLAALERRLLNTKGVAGYIYFPSSSTTPILNSHTVNF